MAAEQEKDVNELVKQHNVMQDANVCPHPWGACTCELARLIREKKNIVTYIDKPGHVGSLKEMEEQNKPVLAQEGTPVDTDLERKRRVYLNNCGIRDVQKIFLELGMTEQKEHLMLLDRAMRDKGFLRIREKKEKVQGAIIAMRAYLQGIYYAENDLIAGLVDEAERLLREKDRNYVPKPVTSGDRTKERKPKKEKLLYCLTCATQFEESKGIKKSFCKQECFDAF